MTPGRRLLAIRPGEGRLVALLAGLFAAVEIGRGLGEIAAETLFISRFGAEFLPYLYVALGLVSLVVALAYGTALGRFRRGPFLVGLLVAFAVLLVVVRLAVASSATIVLPAAWLTVYVFGAILMTLVWTVAATTLDARQAKRLFPICTSAAIAGGFGGTLVAGPVARLLGLENLLLLFAAFLAVAAVITHRISRRATPRAVARRAPASLRTELGAGFAYVRRSPLMRLVAVAYVLLAVLLFSVTFPFFRILGRAFPDEADLATALGLLSAAVTGASFVVSIAVANRVYARFGVATAALLLPIVYMAGFALWLVQFGLVTAVVVRVSQQVTQRGLSNAAWSALYAVVPSERRPQVLAFIDGVPGQIGTSLSGILLIVVGVAFGSSSTIVPAPVFVMGLLAAAACTWVVLRIRRRYGEALVGALRAGLAEQVLEGGPGLVSLGREPDVMQQLRAALDEENAGARRLAIEVLGRIGEPGARELVLRGLTDPAPEVRMAALTALDRAPDADAVPLELMLTDPDPRVRAAAVRASVTLEPSLLVPRLDALAADPHPDVRAQTAQALARLGRAAEAMAMLDRLLAGDESERVAGLGVATAVGAGFGRIGAALDDDAVTIRRAAATALASGPESRPELVEVLESGAERAQDAALAALAGHAARTDAAAAAEDDRVRDWALRQVERALVLRRATVALGPAAEGDGRSAATGTFLRAAIANRERRLEARLLAALAALGAADASGPIQRSLVSPDPDIRAQAIEAVEALGDRRLGRAVGRLLDADAEPAGTGSRDALRMLVDDPDAWIRALALRTLAEQLADDARVIVELAAADHDPIVRAAVPATALPGGSAMPETDRTLGEVERMLFLRRVPLFGKLAPEDLQRIAAAASERLYPAGDALVVEGDVGDELVVIVEGVVRVVRADGDKQRLVRTYAAGDHVGELAVLREAPRTATVIAGDDGVRGLVIGGEGLRAILRERPEAAMAMLATLAERISRT